MHTWGDNVDWDGINDAAELIGTGLRKWGRIQVTQYKEKYGTVRVYCYFGIGTWQGLFKPGFVYNRWPRWIWKLEFNPIVAGLRAIFTWCFYPWQKFIYRWYYRRAVRRWPHLREEILCCADVDELLKDL